MAKEIIKELKWNTRQYLFNIKEVILMDQGNNKEIRCMENNTMADRIPAFSVIILK